MISENYKIKAFDGSTINAIEFRSEHDPLAIIIINHGFGEHSARYQEFATIFTSNGYSCIAYDIRGHGEMDIDDQKRKKLYGITPSYDSLLYDISSVVDEISLRNPHVPMVLYGHSMGGNISVNYLLKNKEHRFSAAILETPWLKLAHPVSPAIVSASRVIGKMSSRFSIINTIDTKSLTRDINRSKDIENDKYYHNRISLRMFSGLTEGGEYALNFAENLLIPTLLISAEKDDIVSSKAIHEFNEKSAKNVELIEYPDACHSIHNDIIKDICYKDMVDFLNRLFLKSASFKGDKNE